MTLFALNDAAADSFSPLPNDDFGPDSPGDDAAASLAWSIPASPAVSELSAAVSGLAADGGAAALAPRLAPTSARPPLVQDTWEGGAADWGAGPWSSGVPNSTTNVLINSGDPLISSGDTVTIASLELSATLTVEDDLTIGAAGLKLDAGATLDFDNSRGNFEIFTYDFAVDVAGAATITDNNFSTFTTPLSGSGSLNFTSKAGDTLDIAGTNGAYSGNLTIDNTTLEINEDSDLGTGVLTFINNEQTFCLDVDQSDATITQSFSIAGQFAADDNGNLTFSGAITDLSPTQTGAFVVGYSESSTLSGVNTYTGGTLVYGLATLSIAADDNINNGPLTLEDDSTLNLTAAFSNSFTVTLAGSGGPATIDDNGLYFDTFYGAISGSVSLDIKGGGGIQFVDDNTGYSGVTTVFGGVIATYQSESLGAGALTLDDNAQFDIPNSTTVSNNINVDGNSPLYVSANDDATLSGVIADVSSTQTGAVTITGGGNITLTGVNTYTGGTTVDVGTTLSISADDNINDGALTLDDDSTLNLTGVFYNDFTITLAGSGGPATIDDNAQFTEYFAGAISGSVSLDIKGGGGILFANNNTGYSGVTTVFGGLIVTYQSESLGTGALTLDDNAGFDVPDSTTVNNAINIDGNSELYISANDDATLSGVIADVGPSQIGALTISGGGTITLTAASTYSGGTTVTDNSTLAVTGKGELGAGGVTLGAGSTLSIGAGAAPATEGTTSIAGTVSGAGSWQQVGGLTTIAPGAVITVAKWSLFHAGTGVILDENLSYAGTFTLGLAPTLSISSGDTLTLTGTSAFSGAISGAGGLTLEGAATIGAVAKFNQARWALAGSGTSVTLNESLSYAGIFSQGILPKLSIASGDTLTLTGKSTLSGAISGLGGLTLEGAATIDAGAKLTQAKWTLAGTTTTVALNASLTYAGTFSQGILPKLSIASGDALTLTGKSALSGAISGAGGLTLAGAATIGAGAKLTQAKWTLAGSATTVALDESLTYAGTFSQGISPKLSISSGDTLMLTGKSTLSGGISGLGGLTLAGAATIDAGAKFTQSDWTLSGAGTKVALEEALDYSGTYKQTGGTIDLDKGNLILGGPAAFSGGLIGGTGILVTTGTFTQSGGAAVDTIATRVENSGKIEALSGTLDLQNVIGGTGSDEVSGAARLKFDADVTSGQTVAFQGAGSVLELTNWGVFSGVISDFDSNGASKDAIDVLGPWAYDGFNQSTGMMTFADNGATHSVHFLGSYMATDFREKVVGNVTVVAYV